MIGSNYNAGVRLQSHTPQHLRLTIPRFNYNNGHFTVHVSFCNWYKSDAIPVGNNGCSRLKLCYVKQALSRWGVTELKVAKGRNGHTQDTKQREVTNFGKLVVKL